MRIEEPEKDVRQIVEQIEPGIGDEGLAVTPRPVRLRQALGCCQNLRGIAGKARELDDMPSRSTVIQSGRR